ncbi:MAG: phosphonate C-P lyase system protein PhnH [Rhodospirillaceae bacterium]|nr:phosphonate C-P lyase system protein PhnH [Rhodospirillaceae bacterium]
MLTDAQDLKPGFPDPVPDAQWAFRGILHAMSYPGRITQAGLALTPPRSLDQAAAAIGLSLFDFDTPLWFDRPAVLAEATNFFQFHCGSPSVATPGEARFAIVSDAAQLITLEVFDRGTDEAPDRSATLIIQVPEITEQAEGVTLSGPGIKEPLSLCIDGLSTDFWRQRRALQSLFPRGIDIVFTAGSRFIGLPRTTLVET